MSDATHQAHETGDTASTDGPGAGAHTAGAAASPAEPVNPPPPRDGTPPPDPPGRRRSPWFGVGATLLTLLALWGLWWVYRRIYPPAPPQPPLVLGVITDPRVGGSDGISPNGSALSGALGAMRGRPGTVSPNVVVLAGELLADTGAASAPAAAADTSRAAAADSARPAARPPADSATAAGDSAGAAQVGTPVAPPRAPIAPPSPAPSQAATLAGREDSLAAALAASPVGDVYVVPSDTLARRSVEAVRKRLAPGVRVVDLTLCYGRAGTDGCWADVPGTQYRLLGVPGLPDSAALDTARLAKVDALLTQARAAGRRVVLVAGTLPPVVSRGAAARPDSTPADTTAKDSGNSAAAPARGWGDLVGRSEVAVLISGVSAGTPAEEKILLVPPLGARDSAALPSRGVGVVSLPGPHLATVAYDDARRTFSPLPALEQRAAPPERPGFVTRFVRWSRSLLDSSRDMAFATIFAIALLFAFLTVAKLWRIEDDRRAVVRTDASAGGANAGAAQASTTVITTVPGGAIFEGNLARTVWSGLTGIAAVTVLTQFWKFAAVNAEALYVVVFVAAFMAFLVLSALVRAVVETLRSRVLTSRPPPEWRPPTRGVQLVSGKAEPEPHHVYEQRVSQALRRYWRKRAWRWALSLREMFLVFFDTFTNVVMGRSYSSNVVWEDKIVDLQQMLLRTADRVREEITAAVQRGLANEYSKDSKPPPPSGPAPGAGGAAANPALPPAGGTTGSAGSASGGSAPGNAGTTPGGGASSAPGSVSEAPATTGGAPGEAPRTSGNVQVGDATSRSSESAGTDVRVVPVQASDRATSQASASESVRSDGGEGSESGSEGAPANPSAPPASTTATTTVVTAGGAQAGAAGGAQADAAADEGDAGTEDPARAAFDPLAVQQGIRVAISVMGDDGQSVFYISSAAGSLAKQFGRESVAWVAAAGGEARWWMDSYRQKNVIVFDNTKGTQLPGVGAVKLRLDDYFQQREHIDYRAFLLIPIPWRRRELPENTRRGAIHISFAHNEWMERLWPLIKESLDEAKKNPERHTSNGANEIVDINPYGDAHTLLDHGVVRDPGLQAVLHESVNVLAELISQFDQTIYDSRLRKLRGG